MLSSPSPGSWSAWLDGAYRTARRVVVAVVGGTLIAAGVAMIVLPGPAFVVIPAGLAVLGVEFAWARRWLRRLRVEALRRSGAAPVRGDGDEGRGDAKQPL